VERWNYKTQDKTVQHIGPTAQDFKAEFNVGESGTGIATVDADGVALAAIQGLYEILREKDAQYEASPASRLASFPLLPCRAHACVWIVSALVHQDEPRYSPGCVQHFDSAELLFATEQHVIKPVVQLRNPERML